MRMGEVKMRIFEQQGTLHLAMRRGTSTTHVDLERIRQQGPLQRCPDDSAFLVAAAVCVIS
jgi:hypothetical protein